MGIKDEYKRMGAIFGAVGFGLVSVFSLFNLSKKGMMPFQRPKSSEEREELLHAQFGERLKCVQCKYCKRRIYFPFFSRPVKHWVPLYCKKFMFTLNGDVRLRCGAMLPEDAERER